MKVKKIYISAPITGHPQNVVECIFRDAEREVARRGASAINPLTLPHPESATYGQYMGVDIEHLIDKADAVFFCRGWEKSDGCMLEFHAAKIYKKEMIFE